MINSSTRRKSRPRLQHRRGSLFHYYMMYLFLSSVLLTTTGVCIHAILKADRNDAEESYRLSTLLRMEQQLRADSLTAGSMVATEADLTILPDSGQIQWTIDDNIVTRTTGSESQLQTSNRFVFPRGYSMEFVQDDTKNILMLVLTHPPRVPGQTAEADPANRPRTEIHVAVPQVAATRDTGEAA